MCNKYLLSNIYYTYNKETVKISSSLDNYRAEQFILHFMLICVYYLYL